MRVKDLMDAAHVILQQSPCHPESCVLKVVVVVAKGDAWVRISHQLLFKTFPHLPNKFIRSFSI